MLKFLLTLIYFFVALIRYSVFLGLFGGILSFLGITFGIRDWFITQLRDFLFWWHLYFPEQYLKGYGFKKYNSWKGNDLESENILEKNCNSRQEINEKFLHPYKHAESKKQSDTTTETSSLFADLLTFYRYGFEMVCEDELLYANEKFHPSQWDFLWRHKLYRHSLTWPEILVYSMGFLIRYLIIFPARFALLVASLSFVIIFVWPAYLIGYMDQGAPLRKLLYNKLYRLFLDVYTVRVRIKSGELMNVNGCLYVCNHSGPLDMFVMSSMQEFACVGQKSGGLPGLFQSILASVLNYVWFERSSDKQSSNLVEKLKTHMVNGGIPFLLFPEGVCVNNNYLLRFRKGAFDAASVVYPTMLKYDKLLGDAFWWQDAWYRHLFHLLTQWAVIVEVSFLPAIQRSKDESGIQLAKRVHQAIAASGAFESLHWDGQLKYKHECKHQLENTQELCSKWLLEHGQQQENC